MTPSAEGGALACFTEADSEVCPGALDGREALRKAQSSTPDLIILDLTMPVLGGFAAAVEVRKPLPEVPMLFYSIPDGSHLIRRG